MAGAAGIKGIDNVMAGLEKALVKLNGNGAVGLRMAVALIRADMDKTPPLIPVKTNNLRGSWFTEFTKNLQGGQVVVFGFSANYAVYVHERLPGAPWGAGTVPDDIDWSRPNSGPKFLEASVKRNAEEALHIIADNMKR